MIETVSKDPIFEFDILEAEVAGWLDIGQPGTRAVQIIQAVSVYRFFRNEQYVPGMDEFRARRVVDSLRDRGINGPRRRRMPPRTIRPGWQRFPDGLQSVASWAGARPADRSHLGQLLRASPSHAR